jgi:hypothetical protein
MGSKSRPSFLKRQKERARQDRRNRKLERRGQRQADRRQGPEAAVAAEAASPSDPTSTDARQGPEAAVAAEAAAPSDPTSTDAPEPDLGPEIVISSSVATRRPPQENG